MLIPSVANPLETEDLDSVDSVEESSLRTAPFFFNPEIDTLYMKTAGMIEQLAADPGFSRLFQRLQFLASWACFSEEVYSRAFLSRFPALVAFTAVADNTNVSLVWRRRRPRRLGR
jgi:hypothetical protein